MAASEPYLAVLKAAYDYKPNADDEIAIKEDQILFLLKRTDDDWWKVKIKGESQEVESAVGLVPAAYVEKADHCAIVRALWDYDAAAHDELTIVKDDVLRAYYQEDDWLLVHSQRNGGRAGFVPANRTEVCGGALTALGLSRNKRLPSRDIRIWHDRSGKYQAKAAFLGLKNGKLRLHKVNGVILEVPQEKMSIEDMEYVEEITMDKSAVSGPSTEHPTSTLQHLPINPLPLTALSAPSHPFQPPPTPPTTTNANPGVPVLHAPKTVALPCPEWALASSKPGPKQTHHWRLGSSSAWPRPRLLA